MTTTDPVTPPPAQQGFQKKLLWLVITMGITMVLLFIILIIALIFKATKPAPIPPVREVSLGLPPGSQLRQTTLQDNKLIIETQQDVYIYDTTTGKQLFHVNISPR